MLLSRRGWVRVTLIGLFLFSRSITGTVQELKLVGDRIAVARIITLAVWIALLLGVLFGVELARFLVERSPQKVTSMNYDDTVLAAITATMAADIAWINDTFAPVPSVGPAPASGGA